MQREPSTNINALTAASASIWLLFTQKAAREALKKMRIEIPGGKMVRK